MITSPEPAGVDMKKVAIIGAGAAGLCCARNLARYPDRFQVQVFEQSQEVGGTWVYSAESGHEPLDVRGTAQGDFEGKPAVHSSMYKNLRTNLPKEIMSFPGFPFNPHLPSFPYHYDVLEYLQQYATHYKLHQYIRFGTQVKQVEPELRQSRLDWPNDLDSVKWRVTVCDLASGQLESDVFDSILLCNGHYFIPHVPDIPGLQTFPGKVLHSHVYREPEHYCNQTVLVVGAGPSGQDLVIDLADHAKCVIFCNRGKHLECALPVNTEQLPAVSEVCQDGVVRFVDGRERKVDSIILATGYLYSYPFLTKDSGVCVPEGKHVFPLYKHTINAVHPTMAFIGIPLGILPFPLFDLQVRWVISVWIGDKSLPSKEEMIKNIEETYHQRLQEGLPPHRASHFLGCTQWDLHKQIVELGGLDPLDPVLEMLYKETSKNRKHNLMQYKRKNFVTLGRDKWKTVSTN